MVDMEPFFDAYRAIKPYLITTGNPPTRERIQSPTDRARYDDTTKCILCACCTTSCPVFWNEGSYFGPAAIVNAHRFIFDSRDEAAAERLDILNEVDGVWRCRTTFNCTESCPRGIEVTKAIQEVKRALMFSRCVIGQASCASVRLTVLRCHTSRAASSDGYDTENPHRAPAPEARRHC